MSAHATPLHHLQPTLLLAAIAWTCHAASTNTPPRFHSAALQPPGAFAAEADGRAGKRYQVCVSTDLTSSAWALIADFTAWQTNFTFEDSEIAGYAARFYRLDMLPGTNPPAWPPATALRFTVPTPDSVRLRWTAATDLLEVVRYDVYVDNVWVTNVEGTSRWLTVTGLGPGTAHVFRIEAVNEDGVATTNGPTIPVNPSPVDPRLVVPELESGISSLTGPRMGFLVTNAIQTGVETGLLDNMRASVLQGTVTLRDGSPLEGVVVSVLGEERFGHTVTRTNGEFDLLVNGGGALTLDFRKDGYLRLQRTVEPQWQEYHRIDVTMIPLDTNVTVLSLPSTGVMTVVQGSLESDTNGQRRAAVLVPQGTTAAMVMEDGTTQELTTLSLRLTEFTVGEEGASAMPSELPPTSAYTYAIEITADEALAAYSEKVLLNQNLWAFVTNFLGMPVGVPVPSGCYDRETGQWIPFPDGRVILITSETNGMAELDVDGDDVTDGTNTLAGMGITDPERERLAELFDPGWTLWRVPVPHLTPWDWNYGVAPPWGSPLPGQWTPPEDYRYNTQQREGYGTINPQNQILRESVGLVGTPLSLHYCSERVPGYLAANTVDIPLCGDTVPAALQQVELVISVAGRIFHESFVPQTNLTYTFVWDGLDAYGRRLIGHQPLVYRVGYVYPGFYTRPPGDLYSTFASANAVYITNRLGQPVPSRRPAIRWQEHRTEIGQWNALTHGLGGWTLSEHHVYDPQHQVLYLGNGRRQRLHGPADAIISSTAGTGTNGFSGDGGYADAAALAQPGSAALAPNGECYIADTENHRIRRVGTDGIIQTVAGTGAAGYGGDGGPATNATLHSPQGVAVGKDGSVWIADSGNHCVRRIGTNGIIQTVAGTGAAGSTGDGGAATNALLDGPRGLAVFADDSFYVSDAPRHRIRRVGTDGIIQTVAGTGVAGYSGDGGDAKLAQLNEPSGIALGEGGALFIADTANHRVRALLPDGTLHTVAGTGTPGYAGDGGAATNAQLAYPVAVAAGRDSALYIAEASNHVVRKVGPDGVIVTCGGTGAGGYGGNDGPPGQAQMCAPAGVVVGPDRRVYVADAGNGCVRRIGGIYVPGQPVQHEIASEDGSKVYIFDESGRHQRTLNALTGGLLYDFAYDAAGRLIQIRDGDGNTTTIHRDPTTGVAYAISGPFGDTTHLTVAPDGMLVSVENPAGEQVIFSYVSSGLLASVSSPLTNTYTFGYDPLGRLVRAVNPLGGTTLLARAWAGTALTVEETLPLARTNVYSSEDLSQGGYLNATRWADGTVDSTLTTAAGVITNRDARGVESRKVLAPDPRFAMEAPLAREVVVRLPSGLACTTRAERAVLLANPRDKLSLVFATNRVDFCGYVTWTTYDVSNRLFTTISPAGRTTTTVLDPFGREIEVQGPGLAPVFYVYNTNGQEVASIVGSGLTARVTSTAYDERGRPVATTNAIGQSSYFFYDGAGRITNEVFPDGAAVAYGYDAEGNLVSVTPPGRSAHRFEFTPMQSHAAYIPPAVGGVTNRVAYTYDIENRPTAIAKADGTSVTFHYDAAGSLSRVDFGANSAEYAFDPTTGVRTALVLTNGPDLAYAWDGNLLRRVECSDGVSGTVTYAYDTCFRPAAFAINGGPTLSNEYDADSLLIQAGELQFERDPTSGAILATQLGGLTNRWAYNEFGEVTNHAVYYRGTNLYSARYERDPLGRIVVCVWAAGATVVTNQYQYDLAGRLARATRNLFIADYQYDANGNLTNYVAGPPVTGVYDDEDRCLQFGPRTFQYTPNGEVSNMTIGAGVTAYAYDGLGNLVGVNLPGGTNIQYVYDGEGHRVKKLVNGVAQRGYLYGGGLAPLAELDGTNGLLSVFVYGTHLHVPDYMVRSGTVFAIVKDPNGSVRMVIDAQTGDIAQQMDYDAFGNVLLDTQPGFQPFGFAGGLYDPDTRLVHFGQREYDPAVGRWTSKDPVLFDSGCLNLYVYAMNDPVNGLDPTGTGPGLWILTPELWQAAMRYRAWWYGNGWQLRWGLEIGNEAYRFEWVRNGVVYHIAAHRLHGRLLGLHYARGATHYFLNRVVTPAAEAGQWVVRTYVPAAAGRVVSLVARGSAVAGAAIGGWSVGCWINEQRPGGPEGPTIGESIQETLGFNTFWSRYYEQQQKSRL